MAKGRATPAQPAGTAPSGGTFDQAPSAQPAPPAARSPQLAASDAEARVRELTRQVSDLNQRLAEMSRQVLASADAEARAETLLRQVGDLTRKLAEGSRQLDELKPLAADGRQYRSDLVDEMVAEGVRAHGVDFDEKMYRSMVASAPLANIKRMRDDFQAMGNARFTGGRQSVDVVDQPIPPAPRAGKPAEAFRT